MDLNIKINNNGLLDTKNWSLYYVYDVPKMASEGSKREMLRNIAGGESLKYLMCFARRALMVVLCWMQGRFVFKVKQWHKIIRLIKTGLMVVVELYVFITLMQLARAFKIVENLSFFETIPYRAFFYFVRFYFLIFCYIACIYFNNSIHRCFF